jgi:hypothetical protein
MVGDPPPFIKEEKCQSFSLVSLTFLVDSIRKHHTIKRSNLDEHNGDLTKAEYTSYHPFTSSHKERRVLALW